MRPYDSLVARHTVSIAFALTLAAAALTSAWFIAPNGLVAGLLVGCSVLSIALWLGSIWFQRYPDWRLFGPAGLAYAAAWASIEAGQGRLGTATLPAWFWEPIRPPFIGATSPSGMAIPVFASMLLAISVVALRRVPFTVLVLAWDVLAINIYVLLASVLPEAGLESRVGGWAAAVFICGLAAWQIWWLRPSARARVWSIAAPIHATPEAVIELLSDLAQRPRWMAAVESAVLIDGQGSEAGSKYLETLRIGRSRMLTTLRIAEKIAAQRLSIMVVSPYLLAEEYLASPVQDGAQVSLMHRWEEAFPISLLGGRWWWSRFTGREIRERKNLQALATLLATAAAAGR
jgi:hypothetical protein